ncbi:LAGLIDADG family homing endonuclease [Candidatus Micrarchaeota archaeon]|nr:LAGLIDADG family homing endonuclease [Candidatus Micrarchaeota archaeon]
MKIKLTPELSYIIGLWRKRRTFDGIGVRGNSNLLETFATEVLEKKLTTTEKLLTEEDKVYFYHTAYRKFFQEVEEQELDRYKYLNEYAASYLAGLFDAAGGIDEKGVVYLTKINSTDELLLLRLGFQVRPRKDRHVVEKPIVFLTFIKGYVKIQKDHRVFEMIKNKTEEKRANEKQDQQGPVEAQA